MIAAAGYLLEFIARFANSAPDSRIRRRREGLRPTQTKRFMREVGCFVRAPFLDDDGGFDLLVEII